MFEQLADDRENSAALALRKALDHFLREVERRALVMAEMATRQREDALDIVQDAMTGFVKSYAHKPKEDWSKLFHSVLSSRITDWHRRQKVRSVVQSANASEQTEWDLELAQDTEVAPDAAHFNARSRRDIYQALQELPQRQREAFLLRLWEGMDVAQTASAMRVSEGSVKTHLSRALDKLRTLLGHLQ